MISLCTVHVISFFAFLSFFRSYHYSILNMFSLSQNGVTSSASSNLVSEIAKARQHIKSSMERVDGASSLSGHGGELMDRISSLEKDNSSLRGLVDGLQKLVISLEGRLNKLEGGSSAVQSKPAPAASSKPGNTSSCIDRCLN